VRKVFSDVLEALEGHWIDRLDPAHEGGCDVGYPELVRSGRGDISRQVGKDLSIMIAVGGGDEAPLDPRLQLMLALSAAGFSYGLQ
jgi:hypothetical protein